MTEDTFWKRFFDTFVKASLYYIYNLPGIVTIGELRHMKLKGAKIIEQLDEFVLKDDGTEYHSSIDDEEDYLERTSSYV